MTLRLLLLKDWRRAHASQVEGVAAAVGRLSPIETASIEVRARPLVGDRIRKLVLGSAKGRAATALRLLYGLQLNDLPPPDLVIASGRPTMAAGSLIARHFGAKFIYSGWVSGYAPEHFDMMLVQAPRCASAPKCMLSPIPCVIDPDRLPQPRLLAGISDLRGCRMSLLIGGKAMGYSYSDADWRALAELVVAAKNAYGIRWSVTDSRRTPPLATHLFAQLARDGAIERFIEFKTAGAGSADDLFAGDAIAVTEDSRSMVAEAFASRRPVVAMRPDKVTPSLAAEEIAAMAAGGGMAVLPIRSTDARRLAGAVLSVTPSQRDPRDLIAAAVAPLLGLNCPT